MLIQWSSLFPRSGTSYTGPRALLVLLIALTIINTVRSLVHIFAPDGGAQSIAGIDTTVASGANIIAIFGQWGAAQLLLALICWGIILRYRAFVPLAFLILFTEQLLRLLAGTIHPTVSAHTPPGVISTYVLLVLLAIALILSLSAKARPKQRATR